MPKEASTKSKVRKIHITSDPPFFSPFSTLTTPDRPMNGFG